MLPKVASSTRARYRGPIASASRYTSGTLKTGRSGLDSFIRTLDLVGILPDPLVGDRGAEDRAKQPVGLGDRDRPERRVLLRAGPEFGGTPGPHVFLPDVADAHLTEGHGQVQAQQQLVELRRLR